MGPAHHTVPDNGHVHLIAGRHGSCPARKDHQAQRTQAGTAQELADEIWRALDATNRVALYVRYTDLFSGRFTSAVKNKLLGD